MTTPTTMLAPPTPAAPTGGDRYGLVGTVVADKYRIEAVVGEGGFGIVYRARHQIWDEPIAVKCFTALADAPVALRQDLLDQFIREGKLLTSLSSRSAAIVQAHDVGNLTTPTGHWLPYMVLEWLDGRSLDAWLGARGPAHDPRTACRLMDGPARALALAHARGVAHRDIKPANFFVLGDELGPGAILKVLDFGIAKVMQGDTAHALRATGAHLSSFTPAYGAPEQFDRGHGATGPWTDVFQMALVLVELMRGGLPALDGDDFVHLAFACQNPARRPTPRAHGIVVSDAVEAVFQRALAVKAADRWRDMHEFWTALTDAVDVAAAPPRPAPPPPEPARRATAAYHVVLEFSRARDGGRPNAFEFSPQVYALRSPGGGIESAEFPWTKQLLDDIGAVRDAGRAPESIHRIGEVLRAFLAAAGWSWHERAILAAAREGAPIYLTIRSAAAELYALPWEFVALKATGQLLGSIPGLLIRYEWPDAPTHPDRIPDLRRGRVLVAWSAAGGDVPAGKLVAILRAALQQRRRGSFDPRRDILAHASPAAIDRALDEAARVGPPIDALHILCHGAAVGAGYGLVLDDDATPGAPVAVDAGNVQQLLAPHAAMLRMVVLAACDSGDAGGPGHHLGSIAQMIHRAGVQDVIASRFPLSTDGSLTLADAFYKALAGEGASLEQAFLAARDALLCNPNQLDWASIQLYSRDADGHATHPLQLVERAPPRPTPTPTPNPHGTTIPAPRRARRRLLPALGALTVALGLGGWFVASRHPGDAPRPAQDEPPAEPEPSMPPAPPVVWEDPGPPIEPDFVPGPIGPEPPPPGHVPPPPEHGGDAEQRRIDAVLRQYRAELREHLTRAGERCKRAAKINILGTQPELKVSVAARFTAAGPPTLTIAADAKQAPAPEKRAEFEGCLSAAAQAVNAPRVPSGRRARVDLEVR